MGLGGFVDIIGQNLEYARVEELKKLQVMIEAEIQSRQLDKLIWEL